MRAHARAGAHCCSGRDGWAGPPVDDAEMLERLCSSSCAPRVHTPAQQTCRNPLESPKRYRATAVHMRSCWVRRSARLSACCAALCASCDASDVSAVRGASPVRVCSTSYGMRRMLHRALRCIVHYVASCADCARVIGSGEAEEEAGNELAEQNM